MKTIFVSAMYVSRCNTFQSLCSHGVWKATILVPQWVSDEIEILTLHTLYLLVNSELKKQKFNRRHSTRNNWNTFHWFNASFVHSHLCFPYYIRGKRCNGFVLHLDLEFVVSSDTHQTFTHCLLRIQPFTCKAATLFLSVCRRQKQFRI